MVRKTSLFLCLVALLCYLLSLLAKRNSQSSTMLELIKDQSVWIFSILARVKSKKGNNINPFFVFFFCKKIYKLYYLTNNNNPTHTNYYSSFFWNYQVFDCELHFRHPKLTKIQSLTLKVGARGHVMQMFPNFFGYFGSTKCLFTNSKAI